MRQIFTGLMYIASASALFYSINSHADELQVTRNMSTSANVGALLNVDNFNSPNPGIFSPLQVDPEALEKAPINDTASLINFNVYSNYGTNIKVTDTYTGSGQAATKNVLTNGTDNIIYAIYYTPCGASAPINLAICPQGGGCQIPEPESTYAKCTGSGSTPGTGIYQFSSNKDSALSQGTYTGGVQLTFSVGA